MPRFDSAAAFATLLRNKDAGRGALALAADKCTIRRCAGNTPVLDTDGSTADDDAARGIDFGTFGQ